MARLDGKVAIVTGAASGLGRADALALAAAGAKVVLTDINAGGVEAAAAEVNAAHPGSALGLQHDVREERAWTEVISATVQRFGRLNVLVNNAGIVIIGTPETTSLEQFRAQQAVMTEGVFLGCKTALPVMKTSGSGSIINVSSIASHLGYPVFYGYSAAKGAVRSMTKAIAVHCQMNKYDIRCNSIHPGAIETAMIHQANQELGITLDAYANTGPGIGQPRNVADVVVFLASDESKMINGGEILLDNALSIQ